MCVCEAGEASVQVTVHPRLYGYDRQSGAKQLTAEIILKAGSKVLLA